MSDPVVSGRDVEGRLPRPLISYLPEERERESEGERKRERGKEEGRGIGKRKEEKKKRETGRERKRRFSLPGNSFRPDPLMYYYVIIIYSHPTVMTTKK